MTICPHYGDDSAKFCDEHVTLDLDGTTRAPRRFYLYDPRDSKVISCVHWRTSASGKGVHILVCFKTELTALEKFLFRMWNHDDIWRLSYDVLRYDQQYLEESGRQYAEGTLFDMKNGKKVGLWH